MEIVESGSKQTELTVPTRSFDTTATVTVKFTNESTNIATSNNVLATYLDGAATFTIDYNATEDVFYYVIMSQSNNELTKFKVYCTDQTDLQNYKITDGDFVTVAQDSDEIINV